MSETFTETDDLLPGEDVWGDEDPDRESTSTVALFQGDEGTLDLGQRRALVYLLKQRFISARTHPKEWKALMANPRPIRSRLADQFMELRIDAQNEVAYKRQVSPEGGGRPFPTLFYDTPWGREDTILLVYLRSRLRNEQASGADRAFVDKTDMLDHIAQYRPASATDQAGDAKKALKAIETLYKAGLLIGVSTADRFEISNALEVLLPLEKLKELLRWLREQNAPTTETLDTNSQTANPTDPQTDDRSDLAADDLPESETGR